jgi:hypothetical protein
MPERLAAMTEDPNPASSSDMTAQPADGRTIAIAGERHRRDLVEADGIEFEQAKRPTRRPQFLQIVAKRDRATRSKPKSKLEQKLTRVAFRVSRLMEFCTKRELQNQTGHSVEDWPLVVL